MRQATALGRTKEEETMKENRDWVTSGLGVVLWTPS